MKFFIILSLVAFCSCLPAEKKQYGDVELKYIDEKAHPVNNFWKTFSQQHQGEEPWNKWAQYGVNNQVGNYWRQYVQGKNQVGDVSVPWIYHYWDAKDYENLSPVQRVQLLLNYNQLHQQWSRLNSDVNTEDYLHQLMYQHLPEYVQYSHEDVLPHLVHYFEQNPMQYADILHETMQSPWTQQQLMYHVMYELYHHYGQAPWTHEQVREHIVKYQNAFPNPLSHEQIEQLVDFVYHIQQELMPMLYQHIEQLEPLNREQLIPWNYEHVLPLVRETVLPWNREQVYPRNYGKVPPMNYEHVLPLVRESVLPWNREQVYPRNYGKVLPMNYEQVRPLKQEAVLPRNYQTIYSNIYENVLPLAHRLYQQEYENVEPWVHQQTVPPMYQKVLPLSHEYPREIKVSPLPHYDYIHPEQYVLGEEQWQREWTPYWNQRQGQQYRQLDM